MKSKDYSIEEKTTDEMLTSLIQKGLPEANENPWFTPRVVNRLPAQSRWGRISIGQWVCYFLGFIGMIAIIVMSSCWFIRTEFSLTTLMMLALVSLLMIGMAAGLMVPTIIRILREP